VLAEALGSPASHKSDPASLSVRVAANGGPDSASDRSLAALSGLSRAGIAVRAFALSRPSLDEVFLALTRHPRVDCRARAYAWHFPGQQIWLSLLATACLVVVFAPLTSYLYRAKN
jgi:hypothetical protein